MTMTLEHNAALDVWSKREAARRARREVRYDAAGGFWIVEREGPLRRVLVEDASLTEALTAAEQAVRAQGWYEREQERLAWEAQKRILQQGRDRQAEQLRQLGMSGGLTPFVESV